MWKKIHPTTDSYAHYSILGVEKGACGMDALRSVFPDGHANDLNIAVFSTSGVHGSYTTIEEAETILAGEATDEFADPDITFLVLHPRLVALRYGVCTPKTQEDIEYLKRLRSSSNEALAKIAFRS